MKEEIIVSIGKKIWGITPIDCAYMRDLLAPFDEKQAQEVYKQVINAERITLNLFAKACRRVKGEAVLKHEVQAKTLLERLHLVVDRINQERKINLFIKGKYPLSNILINNEPAFSDLEVKVLRQVHKTYKELVQYREYQSVRDNLRPIALKFWLAGLNDGYKALKC